MTAPNLPLTSLRAFEAAARRASFKAAAEELFVTPTAISHQIRQLEDYLGVRVLDRTPRAVTLTAAGAALYEATAAGFREIGKIVAQLRGRRETATLTVSSTPVFLSHWMAPRMGELRRLHPEIDLRLHASDEVVELRSGGIEVAIRYGKGPYPGTSSTPLRDDVFAPVCSPRLGISKLKDLRQATLIHIDGCVRAAATAGLASVVRARRLNRHRYGRWPTISRQSASDARRHRRTGVALISLTLVADALATGLLESPFKQTLAGETYHFVCAKDVERRSTDIVGLRSWLLRTLRA